MATTRPRTNVTLHRFTFRVLRQYAEHHELSLSELLAMSAFVIAKVIQQEALDQEEERGIAPFPADVLLDLYRAHPDYDPKWAEQDLSASLEAIRATTSSVEARRRRLMPVTTSQEPSRPAVPCAASEQDAATLVRLYEELAEASRAVDKAVSRKTSVSGSKTGISLQGRRQNAKKT